MTHASNFTLIVGDQPVGIGDSQPVWEQKFSTPDRDSNYPAILMFNIRGLTYATKTVEVKINEKIVGTIAPYATPDAQRNIFATNWQMQTVALVGADIKNGVNEIQINAVGFPGSSESNKYDNFEIKDVICFYHVSH